MQRQTSETTDPHAGKDLGQQRFALTPTLLDDYYRGLDIDPTWYRRHSPAEGQLGPSMSVAKVDEIFRGWMFKNSFGTLWMRQEWELERQIVADEVYDAASRVVDVYEHRGRTVSVHEVTLRTLDGLPVATGRHHQSFLLTQSAGKVNLREPESKEGARRFVVPDGEVVAPVTHTITLELCGMFFHGGANYHTESKSAEKLGFENVVVGGCMPLGYLGDLLDKRFGAGWYEGGRLDLKFTNIVWPGDTLIAKGVVTERTPAGSRTKANLSVWVEKPDGTVVVVGKAVAYE